MDETAVWKSTTRHSGAYVVPRFYNLRMPYSRPVGVVHAHGFGLLKQSEVARSCVKNRYEVTLPQGNKAWVCPQNIPGLSPLALWWPVKSHI